MQGREMVTMVSQGVQELTNSVPPASLEREFEVVTSMIDELNSNFAVELSIDIASVRNHHGSSEAFNCYESSTEKKIRIVLIGASHAARIAAELADMEDVELVDLSESGWRATAERIEAKQGELEAALNNSFNGPTMVVYHVLDNNIYCGSDRDGPLSAYYSAADGKWHIKGNLVMQTGQKLDQMLNQLLPLIRGGREHRKLLISPLRRYVSAPCCADPEHVCNFGSSRYLTKMVDDTTTIRDTMRQTFYRKKILNFRVTSGDKLMAGRTA